MLCKLFAALLILAGVWLAGVTFLPVTWHEDTLNVQVGGTASASQQPVTFRYPRELPDGEQVLFEMTLTNGGGTASVSGNPVFMEGRLELAGVDLFPTETLRVPYHAGQTVSFRWLVTAHAGAGENGTIWLVAIGADSMGQEMRFPIVARPIQVEIRQVLGMGYPLARWVGGFVGMVGLIGAIWPVNKRGKMEKKGK